MMQGPLEEPCGWYSTVLWTIPSPCLSKPFVLLRLTTPCNFHQPRIPRCPPHLLGCISSILNLFLLSVEQLGKAPRMLYKDLTFTESLTAQSSINWRLRLKGKKQASVLETRFSTSHPKIHTCWIFLLVWRALCAISQQTCRRFPV